MTKIGLSFTMDMLKSKTFELAEQESKYYFKIFNFFLEFPSSFFSDQWFDEMGQSFSIGANKDRRNQDNTSNTNDSMNESNIENANDYLLNVITATMAKQKDNDGNILYILILSNRKNGYF